MPWKLYIDSRRRVKGSRGDSDTDFAIQLPYPITVSGKAFIDVVLIPNSFKTIRAGQNDKIYLDETAALNKRVATLAPGQYSVFELKDALVTALNANKTITGQYQVAYNTASNRLVISLLNPASTDTFRIFTESGARANAHLWNATADALQSANRACGLMSSTVEFIAGNSTTSATAINAPDVQPYKQLFIRSNLGGVSAESLGPNGETDIVRRVVVANTPFNGMIHDIHSQPLDCVKINGHPELSLLWFEIIDIDSRVVDTDGLPVSFSIIFQDYDE